MTAFDPKTSREANEIQKGKYEDLSAEMRRRASLRKTFGTGGFRWLKENDPERFQQIIKDREAKRKDGKQTEEGR